MTRFEEMDFEEINHMAKYEGFTIKEETNIVDLGILEVDERHHQCNFCARQHECYLEEWFVSGADRFDITECKYWEARS